MEGYGEWANDSTAPRPILPYGCGREPPSEMDLDRRKPAGQPESPAIGGRCRIIGINRVGGSVMPCRTGCGSELPGGGSMADLPSTSSNRRRERGFSGNSTTSPVSSLEGKQPLLRWFLGEGNVFSVSRPPGPVRPLLHRADIPGQLLMPFQGQALIATAASVDRWVGLLQNPSVFHSPSPFCSDMRINQYPAMHHVSVPSQKQGCHISRQGTRSSPPGPVPLPVTAHPPVGA